MKWTIKLVFEAVPGSAVEHELRIIEREEEISPATVGLTIAEGKALLASLQEQVVTAQVQQHVATIKYCPQCGNAFRTKGHYQSTLRSVYGTVGMRIRRLRACPCSGSQAQSFSTLFTNKSPITPELRYFAAKMAALLPFRKAADFLGGGNPRYCCIERALQIIGSRLRWWICQKSTPTTGTKLRGHCWQGVGSRWAGYTLCLCAKWRF